MRKSPETDDIDVVPKGTSSNIALTDVLNAGGPGAESFSPELAAEALLREHPDALLCALANDGLIVPMPGSIGPWGRASLEGRALIDNVVGADRGTVIETWRNAQADGAANGSVRMLREPTRWMTLHFLDFRERHGVLLGVVIPTDELAAEQSAENEPESTKPRLATLKEDETGLVLECDDAFTQMFGYSAADVLGQQVLDQIHPDEQARAIEGWLTMLSSRRMQQFRIRRRRKDGSWLWVDSTIHNYLNEPGRDYVLVELIDVSAEMSAQEALHRQGELLRRLTDSMPDGLLQVDRERKVVYHNRRLLEILHSASHTSLAQDEARDEPAGRQPNGRERRLRALLDTVTEEAFEHFTRALGAVLDRGEDRDVEVDIALVSGSRRRALMSIRSLLEPGGEVGGAIISALDVTDSARAREELERRATFDELTRCYNRSSILAALQQELDRGDGGRTGILYIDLDRFKGVNDTLGHAAGDELLRVVAERLRAAGRDDDRIGRLGGDEFLVLLRGVPGPEVAMSVARRICEALRAGASLSGETVELRASVGVACTNGDTVSADDLVHRADAAMYVSKAARQGQPVLATP